MLWCKPIDFRILNKEINLTKNETKESSSPKFINSNFTEAEYANQNETEIGNSPKMEIKDDVLLFYNVLAMIMLSILTGGIVGVIFILYFSLTHECYEEYRK